MAKKRCCFDVDSGVEQEFNSLCDERGRKKSKFLELLMRLAVEHYDEILHLAISEHHEDCPPERMQHIQQNNKNEIRLVSSEPPREDSSEKP